MHSTVCTAVFNLRSKLFTPEQAYIALLLNGLRLDELDYEKLTNENTTNTDALTEMERLQNLAKFNENFKLCNF
jgi:hypothetical protein